MKETLREDIKTNKIFQAACRKARCLCTVRQLSKFNRAKGIAWKVRVRHFNPLQKGMAGYHHHIDEVIG